MKPFKLSDVPSQTGKVVIVTGGNIGIGLSSVKGMVSKGATVIIASRSQQKLSEAVKEVKKLYPNGKVEGIILDLAAFSSIQSFVDNVKRYYSFFLILNLHIFICYSVDTRKWIY